MTTVSVRLLFRDWLRKRLARLGFVLFRINSGVPETLEGYLSSLRGGPEPIEQVFSFDSEVTIQTQFLGAFPPAQVAVVSDPLLLNGSPKLQKAAPILPPTGRFLVEFDAERFDLQMLARALPWIHHAQVVLVRASLGYFWFGHGDLGRMVRIMRDNGYDIVDILEYIRPQFFNAPLSRLLLAFAKKGTVVDVGALESRSMRSQRVSQAVTFLSPPIALASELTWLTGRGSFNCTAGVLNPGCLGDENGTLLLARGEMDPWAIMKRSQKRFLTVCRPIALRLDKSLSVSDVRELRFCNSELQGGCRIEDFRLFRYNGQILSNHTIYTSASPDRGKDGPLDFGSIHARVGVSRVDLANDELEWLGAARLDRPTGKMEKNWVFFVQGDHLYLLYSFNPYHLLRLVRWPGLEFETVIQHRLSLPFPPDDLQIRNSANPVDYDASHYLFLVHKVYENKQYAFWAVLISKSSLLPAKVTRTPLICGWSSAPASIIYACSVTVQQSDILVFAGLNDSSMGFWRIPRSRLDENWISLPASIGATSGSL